MNRMLFVIAAACLAMTSVQGHAQARRDHERARAALARGEILPLTKILAIAAARAPGDVIKVELEEDKGRLIYEVRVLSKDGRVREVEVNARTGEVLKVEND
jgi:uncharacterized membrane protein YkoI